MTGVFVQKSLPAFLPVVKHRFPVYLEEIQGIADGSGHSFEDVFTLNCRTELGQQFSRRPGENFGRALRLGGRMLCIGYQPYAYCVPKRRSMGRIGMPDPAQRETMVFVIAKQKDKPGIAWMGEAGLICRMAGINTAGIGLGGNTLFCDAPIDFDGTAPSVRIP